jgi:hypothetical protein
LQFAALELFAELGWCRWSFDFRLPEPDDIIATDAAFGWAADFEVSERPAVCLK